MTRLVGKHNSSPAIIGYCWPWTVRPGEHVDFMVSCADEGCFRADLVRIFSADDLSRPEMFKEAEIHAPFTGEHQGRTQQTHVGSFIEIEPKPILDGLTHFTVQAMV